MRKGNKLAVYTFRAMVPRRQRWQLHELLSGLPDITVYTELTDCDEPPEAPVPTTVVAGVHGLVASLEAIDCWAASYGDVLIVTAKGTKLWLGSNRPDSPRRRILGDWPLRWG